MEKTVDTVGNSEEEDELSSAGDLEEEEEQEVGKIVSE